MTSTAAILGVLQIFWPKSRVTRDASQHPWPDLFAVMECKDKVAPAFSLQRPMRTRLSIDSPTDPLESAQDDTSLPRAPAAHAATVKT